MDLENAFLSTFLEGNHRTVRSRERTAPENTNKEICRKCGGQCCKRCGCHFSPKDFQEISYEFLKKEIEKGYISIELISREYTILDFSTYILRVRNQGAPVVDNGFNRTPCVLLTETGCALSDSERPSGGLFLIPAEERDSQTGCMVFPCYTNYDIEDCALEWKPYQMILLKLVKYFEEHNVPPRSI